MSAVAIVVLLVMALLGSHSLRSSAAEKSNPPSGQFQSVGNHKLHYVVQGEGPITVVMDSGLGNAGTISWMGVEERIASFAQVCTFDRAGLGWSEPGPEPRSPDRELDELRELLRKAGLSGPYVLVGHSLGGQIMRLYASRYPDEVAALVLVDAFNTDTFGDDAPVSVPPPPLRWLHTLRHLGAARLFFDLQVKNVHESIAQERVQAYVDMHSRSSHFDTFYREYLGQSNWREVRSELHNLGQMPVTVLSAKGTAAEQGWSWWPAAQEALAESVSDNVEVVELDCGHAIQIQRPDAVVEAVRRTIERVTQSTSMDAAE